LICHKSAPRVEVRESPIHGKGVFAVERIPKGSRVLEYMGERVAAGKAYARYAATVPFHTFLFDLDDGRVVDGGVGGNESRFINHSCQPTCEAYVERGRIYIYARRLIAAGRELSLDYAFEPEGDGGVGSAYSCQCGSSRCRGSMESRRTRGAS
jgi:SET domain-containing protein